MPLSRLHEDFLAALKAERNVTRQTLVSYRSDWQTFFDFLRKVKRRRDELRYFQADALRDFQVWQSQQGLSAMTVNRRPASLSSFGKWLVRRDYLQSNPVDKVIRARRIRPVARYLHLHELRHLLGLPLPPSEAAMRALFCYAGIREYIMDLRAAYSEMNYSFDILVFDVFGDNHWAQARFLVHGHDDVLWTNDPKEAANFIQRSLEFAARSLSA